MESLKELSLRISLIDLEDVEFSERIPPIPPFPKNLVGKFPNI